MVFSSAEGCLQVCATSIIGRARRSLSQQARRPQLILQHTTARATASRAPPAHLHIALTLTYPLSHLPLQVWEDMQAQGVRQSGASSFPTASLRTTAAGLRAELHQITEDGQMTRGQATKLCGFPTRETPQHTHALPGAYRRASPLVVITPLPTASPSRALPRSGGRCRRRRRARRQGSGRPDGGRASSGGQGTAHGGPGNGGRGQGGARA